MAVFIHPFGTTILLFFTFCRENRRRGRPVGTGNRDLQKAAEGQDRVHGSTAGRAGEVVFGVPVPGHCGPGESGREVRAPGTSSAGQHIITIENYVHDRREILSKLGCRGLFFLPPFANKMYATRRVSRVF